MHVSLGGFIGYVGHQLHVVRRREVGTLFRWLGTTLSGRRVLDVAGGDGYWAGRAVASGASAVALDLDGRKIARGRGFSTRPRLVVGDALALPFSDAAFDTVMSVCAIEHFTDGPRAVREIARVLEPGGDLVLSADCLSRASTWPQLADGHRRRYRVHRTYTAEDLRVLMAEVGLDVLNHQYLFRDARGERLYLELSRFRYAWNVGTPLDLLVRRWDRRAPNDRGSIVLVHARKRSESAP